MTEGMGLDPRQDRKTTPVITLTGVVLFSISMYYFRQGVNQYAMNVLHTVFCTGLENIYLSNCYANIVSVSIFSSCHIPFVLLYSICFDSLLNPIILFIHILFVAAKVTSFDSWINKVPSHCINSGANKEIRLK